MSVTAVRTRLFNLRVNEREYNRLQELAKHYGITAAGVVRMLVKLEEQRLRDEGRPPR